ncbi:hypothetical protein BKA56DRAFT_600873 [Ilyonectria sp. MPI-CAGE-AT-0026]|nr:hypothetical protein BKA56DRAFT_600873 [Ilyonectria sp. MPI-CAGE-AT-0026]
MALPITFDILGFRLTFSISGAFVSRALDAVPILFLILSVRYVMASSSDGDDSDNSSDPRHAHPTSAPINDLNNEPRPNDESHFNAGFVSSDPFDQFFECVNWASTQTNRQLFTWQAFDSSGTINSPVIPDQQNASSTTNTAQQRPSVARSCSATTTPRPIVIGHMMESGDHKHELIVEPYDITTAIGEWENTFQDPRLIIVGNTTGSGKTLKIKLGEEPDTLETHEDGTLANTYSYEDGQKVMFIHSLTVGQSATYSHRPGFLHLVVYDKHGSKIHELEQDIYSTRTP